MAHYTRMDNQQRKLDFRDTFLDWQHLRASFPDYKITTGDEEKRYQSLDPPYELTFPPAKPENDDEAVKIVAKSYSAPNRGT